MRNLKRALSLALATVMTMGLMMVGTGASYKDVKASDNVEAIEVLQEVGIMTGDENGNFNPDKTVTRNEMAVVMSNLLKLDYNYYRGTNPFADVPSWAAPYVAACAAEGVVSGVGGNLYNGEGNVTAAQASLMIMKALGYFQYQDDFGDDWQVATIRQASYINLLDGINAKAEDALTRNQIAQLVLNGLKAEMVEFTGDVGTEATIGDTTIHIGYRAEYTAKTSAAKKYNSIVGSKTDIAGNNQYYVQLGEELYNGDLRLTNDSTDVFGRPARTWSFDGEEIGTFVNYDLMVKEYTTAATGKELYDVVGKTAFDKYDFASYVDGKDSKLYEEISKNNKEDVSNTDNGALTQVFVDADAEEVVVTVINTYLAKADADYNEKKDEANFIIYDGTERRVDVSGEDFAISDVAEGEFYLVTYADKEIQSIADVETLSEVEISKISTSGSMVTSVTVDGTKYDDSAMLKYDNKVLNEYTQSNMKDKTYNVYLDQYGYMIGIEEVDGVDNYVFITGVDPNGSNLTTKSYDANAIFVDGTSKVIEVKNTDDVRDLNSPVVNKWFTYTKNSSDLYTLKPVGNDIVTNVDLAQSQHNATRSDSTLTDNVIDSKHISLQSQNDGKVYGNDDSIYLLADLDKVTKGENDYAVISGTSEVVTGVDNASFKIYTRQDAFDEVKGNGSATAANTSSGVYFLYDEDNYVIAAVVVGESDSVSSKIAYVNSDDLKDESYDKASGEWTWTREVIMNGESVILTEVGDDDDSVLENYDESECRWVTVKYDANGNVKDIVSLENETYYVTNIQTAVDLIEADDEDVIVVADSAEKQYSLKGKTLYDETNQKEGFRIAEDVNVVLTQTVKNKETTDYYTGVNSLKSILEDLNEDANGDNTYMFYAVIEDGRATSVIIIDGNKDDDYEGPDGGNKDPNVVKLSSQNNEGTSGAKIELKTAATKNTTYEVELQMMNNDGDWRTVDTIKVLVKSGDKYGFTPVTGISGNQQYRLVYGELTALLSK